MPFSFAILLACVSTVVLAQTSTDCNPTNTTCPADVGLSSSTFSSDFTVTGGNASWSAAAYSDITYGSDGAVFTIAKKGQAPTIQTDFYMFFGKVEVTMKAASGQGIVSSIVLQSDDLDEIDWEFIGGDNTKVQSNFYGKGNTTTYNRVVYHTVETPQDTWHTYTFDWTKSSLQFLIDGSLVRTIEYSEAVTVFGKNYPQTPMRLKLGTWAGGAAGGSEGTIEWAGGETDFNDAPFVAYVKSVSVTNNNPACSYNYSDMSGSYDSIDVITTGDSCSAETSGNATSDTAASDTVASSTTTSGKATSASTSTSSRTVAPIGMTEAAVSSTVTGSAYSTNSASISALNQPTADTQGTTSGTASATVSGPEAASSYTGGASSNSVMIAGVVYGVVASLWML